LPSMMMAMCRGKEGGVGVDKGEQFFEF